MVRTWYKTRCYRSCERDSLDVFVFSEHTLSTAIQAVSGARLAAFGRRGQPEPGKFHGKKSSFKKNFFKKQKGNFSLQNCFKKIQPKKTLQEIKEFWSWLINGVEWISSKFSKKKRRRAGVWKIHETKWRENIIVKNNEQWKNKQWKNEQWKDKSTTLWGKVVLKFKNVCFFGDFFQIGAVYHKNDLRCLRLLQVVGIVTRKDLAKFRVETHKGKIKVEELHISNEIAVNPITRACPWSRNCFHIT